MEWVDKELKPDGRKDVGLPSLDQKRVDVLSVPEIVIDALVVVVRLVVVGFQVEDRQIRIPGLGDLSGGGKEVVLRQLRVVPRQSFRPKRWSTK